MSIFILIIFFNLTILRNDAAIVKYVENVDEEIE